ncbi:MAG: TonB-dependent receptor, partial [Candidatus Aminicenantes bacterium]|nr:TonB-dependent receptor [Candidatus Aminicenantes bacterium]
KDLSASVSVVDQSDFKAISASNALNLLNYIPGLFVNRTGDFGRADVTIRGLGERGRKIAVLVDGRPEKMSLFGCIISHSFPLDNVERIEVVRGPASVLYGSEALGGVINILTRLPEKEFETNLDASYGSFDTAQVNLSHGGKRNKFRYLFTVDRRSSDGHRKNSQYSGNTFTGKVKYEAHDLFNLSFQGKYFDGTKHEAGTLEYPLYNFWNKYKRGALDLTIQGRGEAFDYQLKFYRNFGRHNFSDGWDSKDDINGGILRFTTRRFRNNELTLGADFRKLYGRLYSQPKGEWDKSEAAVFFQDQLVFKQKWIFSAGFRIHRDSIYGFETSPHGGIVFQVGPKMILRGAVNKGFRSPQLNDLYMYPPSNPDLQPERVWNYEIGFEQDINENLSLNGTVFRMQGSNLVELAPNPDGIPPFKFQNTGSFRFYGGEVGLFARIHANLIGQVFYSYLDTGELTRGRPGHKFDLSIRYQRKQFSASLNSQYVADYFADDFSRLRMPNYFLLSSRLAYEITSGIELFCDLNNLLDTDYQIYVDLPGLEAGTYPMPGAAINLGIRVNK